MATITSPYLLHPPLTTRECKMFEALQNILNGIESGAITSDHDETFAHATAQVREAVQEGRKAIRT